MRFPRFIRTFVQDSEEFDHVERATASSSPLPISAASRPSSLKARSRTTRWPSATTTRTRSSSASAWKTCCVRPSATGIPSPGTATTSSVRARSTVRGTAGADDARAPPGPRWTPRSISSRRSARRSIASTTWTRCRPRPTSKSTSSNLAAAVDRLEKKQAETGIKLLWGTANLFSHPRYMGGASTNPDPDVWAFAATQVRHCMDATKRLGGANYVLWGGREGYDTLLNTSLKHELANFGRFLQLVVEHKHKIGFKGTILIEPKPHEPTKHQYDFDTATVYGFLKKNGLENEVKVNIEANHATLAGHSFEHEIAMADALGIFGSIDINRGDPQNGWDTDQFHNDPLDMTLAMYRILKAGGFTTGGFNFDAKVRRQSHRPGRHVLRPRRRARPAGAHAAVGGGAHRERRHRQVRRAALRQVGGRGRARRFTPRVRRSSPSPMRRSRPTSIRSRSRVVRNTSRTWSTGSSDRFRGMAAHRVRPASEAWPRWAFVIAAYQMACGRHRIDWRLAGSRFRWRCRHAAGHPLSSVATPALRRILGGHQRQGKLPALGHEPDWALAFLALAGYSELCCWARIRMHRGAQAPHCSRVRATRTGGGTMRRLFAWLVLGLSTSHLVGRAGLTARVRPKTKSSTSSFPIASRTATSPMTVAASQAIG